MFGVFRDIQNLKIRWALMLMPLAVLCCSLCVNAQDNQVTYPVLKLDIGRGHDPAEIQEGFTAFTVGDSGTVVDGIKVEIETMESGEAIQPRWRGGPTGIPYEQLYRDFIFTVNGGLKITLSGLNPNETYEITMYSWDQGSAEDHLADWSANGDFCLTTNFSGGTTVDAEDSFAFSGYATADDTGKIVLEATPNPSTSYPDPPGEYFCFLNALEVSSLTPITKARNPVPGDGDMYPTTVVDLSWTPGATAISHNVYFGDNFIAVEEATTEDTDIFLGSATDSSFHVAGLTPGVTYYWRIDEVEPGGTVHTGDVWRFTVPTKTAFNPIPVNGSLFIDPNITLRWFPGANSAEHYVYFGDNLEDVQNGTGGTNKGAFQEPNFYPGLLESEKTYYWRVDESDYMDVFPGDVWSFTTTLEDCGTVVIDMWEDVAGSTLNNLLDAPAYPDNPTWSDVLTEFSTADSIGDNYGARIHGWLYVPLTGDYTFWLSSADEGELWLSTDDEPENVQLLAAERVWGWYDAFSIKSDPIPLIGGNRYYIMAIWKEGADWDHCQAAWQGPGIPEQEIIQGSFLSPYEPVIAFGEVPHDGTTEVKQTPTLRWKPGKYAASHNVYFGSDPNALNLVATSLLGSEYYKVTTYLQNNQTYYWRIDEVNNLNPEGPWVGEVWSFTVANYTILDDFEDYNDALPDRIFDTWADGWNVTTNGSQVGYGSAPFAERTITNSGLQSMPFFYNNTGGAAYSEAVRSFDAPLNDWTREGVQTLTLFFRGYPAEFVEDPAGTYAMGAGGEDIWDVADQFRYAYKMLSGDGSITARVVSIEDTDEWAKAGVMIRDTLDDYSVNAFMCATQSNRRSFQNRQIIAETSFQANSDANAITLPLWVKVVRQGNNFTGYYSQDENHTFWIQQPTDENTAEDNSPNPQNIVMSQNIYIGLAYTSHNIDEMGTAVFDNVETTGTVTGDDWEVAAIGANMPVNEAQPLYVVVQDGGAEKIVEHPDNPNAVLEYTWQQWDIPLSVLSDAGVNLSAIQNMTIGVGIQNGQGGTGKLYFDDIRLYP